MYHQFFFVVLVLNVTTFPSDRLVLARTFRGFLFYSIQVVHLSRLQSVHSLFVTLSTYLDTENPFIMPAIAVRDENSEAMSTSSPLRPIYIAGFVVVGVLLLGVALWLAVRTHRRRGPS